jgi:hypothetical protein
MKSFQGRLDVHILMLGDRHKTSKTSMSSERSPPYVRYMLILPIAMKIISRDVGENEYSDNLTEICDSSSWRNDSRLLLHNAHSSHDPRNGKQENEFNRDQGR